MSKLHQTELSVKLTQQRSFQTLKLWHLLQSHFSQPPSLQRELLLVLMYGLMNNSCQRIVLLASILTRRLEIGALFWEMP